MRNIHKALIATFCSGVFLAGLGTGIAVYEFSTFTYAGEVVAGEVEMETQEYDCPFEPLEESRLEIREGYHSMRRFEGGLVLDESVPENTVRFKVTYNAKAVSPYIEQSEYVEYIGDGEERVQPYVSVRSIYIQDDLKAFMSCKDEILENIRNKRVASYEAKTIESVRVHVNPASSGYVYLN